MYIKSVTSFILVFIQFGCIIGILLTGEIVLASLVYKLIIFAGILLGILAILEMRHSKLNVSPDIKEGATIIKSGPYKWIRHPMYLAVLTVMLAVTLADPNPARWILIIVLTINLLIKMHHEERLLVNALNGYETYQKSTKKILPFIY